MPWSGLGAGTTGDPYQVTTLAQLYEMRDYNTTTTFYLLMNNIDASDTSSGANTLPYNGPAGWVPGWLAGTFRGNNKSITGLWLKNVTLNVNAEHGMFSFLGQSSRIENLTLEITHADPGSPVDYRKGGLAATALSGASISNCTVTTKVFGEAAPRSGGLVYEMNGSLNVQSSSITSNLEVETEALLVYNLGGRCGLANDGGINRPTMIGLSRLKLKSNNPSSTFYNIGGAAGHIDTTLRNQASAEANIAAARCNTVIDVKGLLYNVGGIVGLAKNTCYQSGDEFSNGRNWAEGAIKSTANGCYNIGGLYGQLEGRTIATQGRSQMDIILPGTGHSYIGGIAGLKNNGAETFTFSRFLTLGLMEIGSATNWSPILPDASVPESCYWNVDTTTIDGSETGLVLGSATSRTDAQCQSLATVPLLTPFWNYSISISPYVYVGTYSTALIIYTLELLIIYELEASRERISSTSYKLIATVTNTEDYSQIQSATIEYIVNGGAPQIASIDPFTNPMEAVATGLVDEDIVVFRGIIERTDETLFQTSTVTFEHFELIQVEVTEITPTDSIVFDGPGGELEANRVHGIVLANGYVFGSTRHYGRIVRVAVDDYLDREVLQLTFDGNPITEAIDEIVFCNGFIWGAAGTKLIRINPDTLDFDVTIVPNSNAFAPIATSNGRYIYVSNETSVSKYDTNLMTGATILTNVPGGLITNALVGVFIKTALNSNNLTDFVHSWASDNDYLYLAYTTGFGVDRYGFSWVMETLKIRISDMTLVGRVDHPKATDDMTQNETHLFYGIEATALPVVRDLEPYGAEWGGFAIRKTDLNLTHTGKYHEVEYNPFLPERATAGSYASLIFGDVLVDMKLDNRTYLIDITNVDLWSGDDLVGQHTLGVIDFIPPLGRTPNELKIDENGYFHAFTWPGGMSPDAESGLIRFLPPEGFAFTGPPSIQSVGTDLVSGLQYRLNGFILNQNGQPVTATGFEYGTGNDPDEWEDSVSASVATNFNALVTIDGTGTWYYRAFGTNSLGTGYGEVLTVTGAGGVAVLATPTFVVTGRNSALSAVVTSVGGGAITAQGFEYGPAADNLNETISGTLSAGVITATIEDLVADTYYFRAYATNSEGTAYSSVVSFVIATQYKIEGTVVDVDGNPLNEAKVYAVNNTTGAIHQTTTDITGAYLLEGLSTGVGYHIFSVAVVESVPKRSIVKAYASAIETA
jgi:hypothetical protein